jgi:hypothetical protein
MKVKRLVCIFSVFIICVATVYFVAQRKSNTAQKIKSFPNTAVHVSTSIINAVNTTANAMVIFNNLKVTNTFKLSSNTVEKDSKMHWLNDEMTSIESQVSNLNKNVLKISLTAYEHAKDIGITKNPLLTIVDYSVPSTKRRLWVIDLINKKVLFNTWVAHGKNSGNINPDSFSNKPESLKSSIGVFVTSELYSGKHGNSLRVKGLESGFNDNAYDRKIVFHGAHYVSENMARSGRLGRSWGCWAVSQDIIGLLVKTIRNKALVVAYYPDKSWLSKSTFLN